MRRDQGMPAPLTSHQRNLFMAKRRGGSSQEAAAEAAGLAAADSAAATEQPAFRFVVGLLPVYFLIATGLFVGGVAWLVRDRVGLRRLGGFADGGLER